MSTPFVVPLVDEGLGNNAYLVDLGDGRGLVVDASRDLRAVRIAAEERGLSIGFAAETHLHADFVSGACQLAATDGARVLASAAGGRRFTHTGLGDEDEVDLGGLRLRALSTPGHTDEHVAYLLLDGQRPVGVFTGGSLIVGSAARTDLVDAELTEELARAQYRSIQRLLMLPDDVSVWPTHGAGSFCSAPAGGSRTSTVGTERATNPLLQVADEDEFVDALMTSLGSYPEYFDRLAEVNRRGPRVLDQPPGLPDLSADEVRHLQQAGAVVVDLRPVADFAGGHVPGSVSIPLRPAFATWLGWVTPQDRPLVMVRNPDQDLAEASWQAMKIGYDNLAGELAAGIGGWAADGQPVATVGLTEPMQVGKRPVLDVRQHAEYVAGHIPQATHLELGSLAEPPTDRAATEAGTVVMCGHGERAMTAASLLLRGGARDLSVLVGGVDDWMAATGEDASTDPQA